MPHAPLLAAALLAFAAAPVLAGPPPGYRVEGCETGTCRLVREKPIGRDLGAGTAYGQAQRGFETRQAEDAPGGEAPRSAPAGKPSCPRTGATSASCPLSGGPMGPALEVPPPGAAAAKAEGAGGAAAAKGGGCKGGQCKTKRKGLLGFFDTVSGFFSSLLS